AIILSGLDRQRCAAGGTRTVSSESASADRVVANSIQRSPLIGGRDASSQRNCRMAPAKGSRVLLDAPRRDTLIPREPPPGGPSMRRTAITLLMPVIVTTGGISLAQDGAKL